MSEIPYGMLVEHHDCKSMELCGLCKGTQNLALIKEALKTAINTRADLNNEKPHSCNLDKTSNVDVSKELIATKSETNEI